MLNKQECLKCQRQTYDMEGVCQPGEWICTIIDGRFTQEVVNANSIPPKGCPQRKGKRP